MDISANASFQIKLIEGLLECDFLLDPEICKMLVDLKCQLNCVICDIQKYNQLFYTAVEYFPKDCRSDVQRKMVEVQQKLDEYYTSDTGKAHLASLNRRELISGAKRHLENAENYGHVGSQEIREMWAFLRWRATVILQEFSDIQEGHIVDLGKFSLFEGSACSFKSWCQKQSTPLVCVNMESDQLYDIYLECMERAKLE
jgi:hypothetical protein